jgi:type VII secretion integral membrane protein EccD
VAFASSAPGEVGAAHLFIAALATAVLTCGVVAITPRHLAVAATVVALCVVGGLVAAARMWRPVPAQWLGMLTLIGLLLLLTLGPTFALWAARIRPPHFGSITGRDVFRRNDGLPVDTVSPVDEDAEDEPNPDTTPRGAVITEAAKRANSVLTGICLAAAIALPLAVWATLMPGRAKSNAAAVLAGLFVLIFVSRGRAFADRRQAVALVCGAAAAFCVGIIRYALAAPADSGAALLWAALILAVFAGAGLATALLVPVTRFTPLVRMVAEWLELVAIVAAFPLAAWVGGLFTWVRMR